MNPDSHTIAEHMLDVGHGHTLYVHDWGNKSAKHPIIFLHGGPGGNTKDKHKTPFDPLTQRVVFFDQRGGGKSLPNGRWHHNTTEELAGDITKIADYLKINMFILTGASWGSTLALYYAIQEPTRVEALVISGVLTGAQNEIDWVDKGMFQAHFPEAWEQYQATVPAEHRADPSAFHFEQAMGNDVEAAKASALAYSTLEGSAISLDDNVIPTNIDDFDPAGILIEMRYLANRCFMPNGYILDSTDKITMPVYIVQGRYDMICPPKTAYTLHKLLPNSSLTWVVSGHKSEHETVTAQRLIYRQLTTGL